MPNDKIIKNNKDNNLYTYINTKMVKIISSIDNTQIIRHTGTYNFTTSQKVYKPSKEGMYHNNFITLLDFDKLSLRPIYYTISAFNSTLSGTKSDLQDAVNVYLMNEQDSAYGICILQNNDDKSQLGEQNFTLASNQYISVMTSNIEFQLPYQSYSRTNFLHYTNHNGVYINLYWYAYNINNTVSLTSDIQYTIDGLFYIA